MTSKFRKSKSLKFLRRRLKIILVLIVLLILAGGLVATRLISSPENKPCFSFEESVIVNQPSSDAGDYFPLAIGNEWRYKSRAGEEAGLDLTFKVLFQDTINGKLTYAMRNKQLNQDEYYEKSGDGIFFHRLNDADINPPQLIIPLSLAAGVVKDWEGTIGGVKFSSNLKVIQEETIAVPAGKFTAWKIQIENKDQQGALLSRSNRWLAPGVGLIKEKGMNLAGKVKIEFCAELAEYHLK